MIPLSFQPFAQAAFPAYLLGKDGALHCNQAAKDAGPPFSEEAAMASLLRTYASQMANSSTPVLTQPLLADALQTRSLTLMAVEDGTLAVASGEGQSPVSIFSSQMRDSLTNIFMTLPIVKKHMEDDTLKYAEDIQANCYQLLRLASNLEDAGLIENRHYDLQAVDLAALVDSLCHSVDSIACNRQIKLAWEVPEQPVIVQAVPRLLTSAFLNILRNSMAYTRDGNHITVKLAVKGKNALLTIEDKGLGILPENVTRIFEPYFSVDPYGDSHVRPGVGLGLSVTREAVIAFGGTVSAESRFGEGTRIILFLPLSTETGDTLSGEPASYILNSYSPLFVQMCGYCLLPHL